MQGRHLPGLLEGIGRESGISMERALKQIRHLLDLVDVNNEADADMLDASIADVEMMIRRVQN